MHCIKSNLPNISYGQVEAIQNLFRTTCRKFKFNNMFNLYIISHVRRAIAVQVSLSKNVELIIARVETS